MTHQNQYSLTKRPRVLSQFGWSNTTLHQRINDGLMPTSISTGDRSVAWVQQELDTVLAAMVAGKSKADIRTLVSQLLNHRKHAA